MKTFSIHCKAKNLLATLALLLAAAPAAACDPGPDPDPNDGDTGDETETTSEESTGDGGSSTGSDGDEDSTGGETGDGVPPDMGVPTCESLCPPETTLECGDGERCVPTPTHPECQPC